jgi:iron complex transport system substrate-binding protein
VRRIGWIVVVVVVAGCAREPGLVAQRPTRIISLTLATDEVLSELVTLDRVVGISAKHLVDDPEISNVAGYYPTEVPRLTAGDLERVIGLAPDLVLLAPYNTADHVRLLERADLPIHRYAALHSFDEIEASIRELGVRVDEREKAEALAARFRKRREALARRLEGAKRPRVLYWTAGYTAGANTTQHDLILAAGGTNVAADRGVEGHVPIDAERLIADNPDFILVPRWSGDAALKTPLDQHPVLRDLPAVKEGRVVYLPEKWLSSVSQFAIEGSERLARVLHPERHH